MTPTDAVPPSGRRSDAHPAGGQPADAHALDKHPLSEETAPVEASPVEAVLRERVAHLERELAATRERLRHVQEIDQIYTNFALAVSHELRTPLTLISGYAQQLLLRWNVSDETKRHAMVEKINVSSRRLARLIDDMLLIADVEAGDLPIQLKNVALRDAVDHALDDMSDRMPSGLPATGISGPSVEVLADGFRLEQVLICLLDHAVKRAPPHTEVTVTWACAGGEAVIAVADRGLEIGPGDLSRLFTRFGRLHNAMRPQQGMVGLGLYIARRLTEAMNGRIWALSDDGGGGTLCVALPLATQE